MNPREVRQRLSRAASVLMGREAAAGATSPDGQSTEGLYPPGPRVTETATADEVNLLERVREYTMTGAERLLGNIDAVDYVVRRGVPGSIVECGVWRGGSVLIMVERLIQLGVSDRDIYLFDTFEGMTAPTEEDDSKFTGHAMEAWEATAPGERAWADMFSSDLYHLDGVRELLESTGYPKDRLHFAVGPVEETLPEQAPDQIAILRLDTDWYESTAHELAHLYPLLSAGGVLIIDDYGHFQGARKAVDEYFQNAAAPILLSRLDYTARIGTKR